MVVKLLNRINEFVYGNKPEDLVEKVGSWFCTVLLAAAVVDAVIAVGGCWYYGGNPFFPGANKQQTSVAAPANQTSVCVPPVCAPSDYNRNTIHNNYNN